MSRPDFHAALHRELARRDIAVFSTEVVEATPNSKAAWRITYDDEGTPKNVKVARHRGDTPVTVAAAAHRILAGKRKEKKRLSGARYQILVMRAGTWKLASSAPTLPQAKQMLSAMGGITKDRILIDRQDRDSLPEGYP